MPLLEVDDLSLDEGGTARSHGITFRVADGELAAVIGDDRDRLTGVLNCISGIARPRRGRIVFAGVDIVGRPPHRVARLGLARTFPDAALFPELDAVDNVMIASQRVHVGGIARRLLSPRAHRRAQLHERARCRELLARVGAGSLAERPAHGLSEGAARRVELARALASSPRLLVLDQPLSGLSSDEAAAFASAIREVRGDVATTVLVAERAEAAAAALGAQVVGRL